MRQAALADDERVHPLVRQALPFVGHFVTRNRGTVGGSIAHADGAAELPLCLVALGGVVVAEGPSGRREIPAEEFFVTHFLTTLQPGELVVETAWPLATEGEASAFVELALRTGDFAQSMVAVVLRREAGVVSAARVAVGAVTDRPTRLREVEELLVGSIGADAAADAGALAARLVDPPATTHASASYLRELTGTLTARAIEAAAMIEIELTVNGRLGPRVGRAAAAPDGLPPPPARPHGHARRLRARRLRRVHGAPRRRRGARLLPARRAGRRVRRSRPSSRLRTRTA